MSFQNPLFTLYWFWMLSTLDVMRESRKKNGESALLLPQHIVTYLNSHCVHAASHFQSFEMKLLGTLC